MNQSHTYANNLQQRPWYANGVNFHRFDSKMAKAIELVIAEALKHTQSIVLIYMEIELLYSLGLRENAI